jgi:hypothetical protein
MKVELEPKDMVSVLQQIKDDLGAHFAAVEAERETSKLPWVVAGTYVDNILEALATYYSSQRG